ncbi:MAG: ribonuclease E inhibitor RraB [Pseudomonadota bacterium]
MDAKYVAIGLVAIAALSLLRIFSQWRRASRKQRTIDWDVHFIQQLRKAGVGAFEEHSVDFFFTVPVNARRDPLVATLRNDGYVVDVTQDAESGDFSVHARCSMRLAIPEMQALRVRFTELANLHGATYDNWAVGVPK